MHRIKTSKNAVKSAALFRIKDVGQFDFLYKIRQNCNLNIFCSEQSVKPPDVKIRICIIAREKLFLCLLT